VKYGRNSRVKNGQKVSAKKVIYKIDSGRLSAFSRRVASTVLNISAGSFFGEGKDGGGNSDGQGCQIFLGPNIPKRKKYIPNDQKLYRKAVNYTKWL
jgi:hypothetical protein